MEERMVEVADLIETVVGHLRGWAAVASLALQDSSDQEAILALLHDGLEHEADLLSFDLRDELGLVESWGGSADEPQ